MTDTRWHSHTSRSPVVALAQWSHRTVPLQRHATPVRPSTVDPATPFAVAQEARDDTARAHDELGDTCRRWTTCTRCGWVSPELVFYTDQDAAEDDHTLLCTALTEPRVPIDEDLELWTYPEAWTFTHRLEPMPAPATSPRPRRFDPTPFPARRGTIPLAARPKEAA